MGLSRRNHRSLSQNIVSFIDLFCKCVSVLVSSVSVFMCVSLCIRHGRGKGVDPQHKEVTDKLARSEQSRRELEVPFNAALEKVCCSVLQYEVQCVVQCVLHSALRRELDVPLNAVLEKVCCRMCCSVCVALCVAARTRSAL